MKEINDRRHKYILENIFLKYFFHLMQKIIDLKILLVIFANKKI